MSSAHNASKNLFRNEPYPDPGSGGTITADRSPCHVDLVSAGAEARTISVPTRSGTILSIGGKTVAGTITLTFTSGMDEDDTTTFSITAAGQFIMLESYEVASDTFRWRKIADYTTGLLSPTEAGYLEDVVAGTSAASKADVRDSSGNLLRPDDDIDYWGTGSDVGISWNGTYLVTTSPVVAQHGPWSHGSVPSVIDPNFHRYCVVFDWNPNTDNAATTMLGTSSVDDGGTGTNTHPDVAGGALGLVTAAADNDYHAMASLGEIFLFASGKKLWFEAMFSLTEATTNESAWWFGLTDTLTTGGFQADTGGPLASYDGALIWKDEATMAIDFETSNAGTQATTTNMGTFVSATVTRVGFHFDGTATTSVVTPYISVDNGIWVAGTAQNITLSGLEEMHLVAGVKAGPSAGAETLRIFYLRCWQLR